MTQNMLDLLQVRISPASATKTSVTYKRLTPNWYFFLYLFGTGPKWIPVPDTLCTLPLVDGRNAEREQL